MSVVQDEESRAGLAESVPDAPVSGACVSEVGEASREGRVAEDPVRAAADSFGAGICVMLVLTIVQRLVGFFRSILFCGVLEDDQLGRWSLAFSFLLLAAPLAVAGLPGSFGRYVEYYRSRGQLGTFLHRTIAVCLVLVAVSFAVMLYWSPFWAWLVLGDATQAATMRLLAATLGAVIVFNFVTELLTAMRKVRAVAVMQFTLSILFAGFAVLLLTCTALREEAVMIAFGLAALFAVLVVQGALRDVRREAATRQKPLSQRSLWSKLAPFAAWLWLTNLLANLFDAGDRFMIVHFAKEASMSSESLVGQYHSSRVVPYLLIGITTMVAGIMLPYLTREWEAGERQVAMRRQQLAMKLGALLLTFLGVCILCAAPLLFGVILGGEYEQGLCVLPWTVTYCVWFSMIMLAQNYLFCIERARLGTVALGCGLLLNLCLNLLLLPRFGLIGAVVATATGNACGLVLILLFSRSHGLAVDRSLACCCGLPFVLVFGAVPAVLILSVFGAVAFWNEWLFSEQEREELSRAVAGSKGSGGAAVQ